MGRWIEVTDVFLITGGAGFIGRKLTENLIARGARVRILDNLSPQIHGADAPIPAWTESDEVEFMRGSVTDRADWLRALAGVTAVAHLAAETGTGQSMYEIARYNEVNSQGTALLLDILAQSQHRGVQRIVLTSSRSVYGEGRYHCTHCGTGPYFSGARSAEALAAARWDPECPLCGDVLTAAPTQEIDATQPESIYAATKLAQEDLVRVACKTLGIGHAILRLQNVYGEGQSLKNPYTGILSIFSTKLRHGAVLPLFEDGEETRDFVHVEDVAESLARALTMAAAAGTVINIGSGIGTSVREVAALLSDALGKPRNLQVTGEYRLGDIRHNVADITRMGDILGFRPQIDLATGIGRFARWATGEELPEDRLDHANAELRQRGLMG
jgi:dTDP-L-rhamnose 4-epimerase